MNLDVLEERMVTIVQSPVRPRSLGHAGLAGLAAGTVAGVVAALASLALRSPDRVIFNGATIAFGAVIAGLGSGVLWGALRDRPSPWKRFIVGPAAAFAMVAVGSFLLQAADVPVTNLPGYVIPTSAIVFGGLALLTPVFVRLPVAALWTAVPAAVAAVALGAVLAGRQGGGSGRLALPSAPAGTPFNLPEGSLSSTTGPITGRDVTGVEFAVVPGESKATYTIREKLVELPASSDAVGSTTQVAGSIFLDGRPSTIRVDLKTLTSDQPRRDRTIQNVRPGLSRYAPAEFTVASLGDLPAQYRPGETVTRNVQGTMTINNLRRPLTFAVEARLEDSTLFIHGTTDFTWADFQMPPPNFAGIVQVEDNIHAEVLLVARHGQ